ncbi:MAG: C25 family cysteine peptidase [bacterium]
MGIKTIKMMMSNILLFSLVLLFYSPILSSQTWITVDPHYPMGSPPVINILDSGTDDYTIYQVKIPGFWCEVIYEGGQVFQKIWVPAYGTMMEVGKPELPVVRGLLGYPPTKNSSSIQILSSDWTHFDNYLIYPHQPSIAIDSPNLPFEIDIGFYNQDVWYPSEYAYLSDEGKLRDVIVVNNNIQLFQYNQLLRSLMVAKEMKIRVNYSISNKENRWYFDSRDAGGIISHPDFIRLYDSLIWNSQQVHAIPHRIATDYLIITGDKYYDALTPLVQLLADRGYLVDRVNMSEIYTGINAYDGAYYVYDYIKLRYQLSDIAFVLLVGDVPDDWGCDAYDYNTQVPFPYWAPGWDDEEEPIYFRPSDVFYACLDNPLPPKSSVPFDWQVWWDTYDIYPDVYVGRLTADNIYQVEVQVNKIDTYERNLSVVNEYSQKPWYDTMLFVGCFSSYWNYIGYKENIKDDEYDLELPDVKTCWGDKANISNDTVMSIINDGCNIVNYFGEGYYHYWVNWTKTVDKWGYTSFMRSPHITGLENNNYVVVFNVGCSMGCIDTWNGDSICDYWMRLPSPLDGDPYHGAVATTGSTRKNWFTECYYYDRALFQTMFGVPGDGIVPDEPLNMIGALHYSALVRATVTEGGQKLPNTDILSNIFTFILLGEPSMEIRNHWTEIPGKSIVKPNNLLEEKPLEITFYPNPSSGTFTMEYKGNMKEIREINIYDISGRLIKSIDIPATDIEKSNISYNVSEGKIDIDISGIKDGLYLINFGNKVYKKILIVK